MSLNSRYGILYFLVLFTLCKCFRNYDEFQFKGTKMRAQKIQEYGERLSSVEDEAALKLGRYEENTKAYDAKVLDRDEASEGADAGNNENENSTTSSTLCTTDKEIDIGSFQPVSGEENSSREDDDHANALGKPGADSNEVAVTKVYVPPKKDQLPDHYIDDV